MMGDSITQAKKALGIALKALPTNAFSTFAGLAPPLNSSSRLREVLGVQSFERAELSSRSRCGSWRYRDIGALETHLLFQKAKRWVPAEYHSFTDGEVGNEQQIFDLVKDHRGSLKVFAIGIGAGCNEYFIKGLARATGGASEFIFPGERIEPKVLSIFNKVGQTGLMDAVIEWGMPDAVQAPSLPAIFLGSPVTLFARFPSGDSFSKGVTVKGAVNGIPRSFEIAVEEASNEALPVALLWARERIRDLEEGNDAKLGSRQIRKQKESRDKTIIDLSKDFNLLSQLTSFVAVEEREEKDQATGEMVLREVPALVTVGWHGSGNILRHRPPAAFPGPRFADACLSLPDRYCELRSEREEPRCQFSLHSEHQSGPSGPSEPSLTNSMQRMTNPNESMICFTSFPFKKPMEA